MTNDLVKRLRTRNGNEYQTADIDALEAADRIEELEKALQEIAGGARDADKSYLSLFYELKFEARAALGEKPNDQ